MNFKSVQGALKLNLEALRLNLYQRPEQAGARWLVALAEFVRTGCCTFPGLQGARNDQAFLRQEKLGERGPPCSSEKLSI